MTKKESEFWELLAERTSPDLMTMGSLLPLDVFADPSAPLEQLGDALAFAREATERTWATATRLLGPHGHGYPLVVQLRDELVKRQEYMQGRLSHFKHIAESARATASFLEKEAANVGMGAPLGQAPGISRAIVKEVAVLLSSLTVASHPRNRGSNSKIYNGIPLGTAIKHLRLKEANACRIAASVQRSHEWARYRTALVDNVLWQFEAYGHVVSSKDAVGRQAVSDATPRASGRPLTITDQELWRLLQPLVAEAGEGEWWKDDQVVVSRIRKYLRKYQRSFLRKQKSDSRLDGRIRKVLQDRGIRVLTRHKPSSEV